MATPWSALCPVEGWEGQNIQQDLSKVITRKEKLSASQSMWENANKASGQNM